MVQRNMEQQEEFASAPEQPGGSSGSYVRMEPGTDALSMNPKLIKELTGDVMSFQSMGPRTWVAEHPQRPSGSN